MQAQRLIVRNNFDQWVFQGSASAAAAQDRIATSVKLQIADVDRACGLSEEERQKLQLAASGDVRRFLDQVEALRAKFVGANNDQNAFNQMWQEIQPLQAKMASGLLRGDSLFAKTINKTLSPERLARHQAVQRERAQYRYRATIETALCQLEGNVPLTAAQHDALVELLIAETPVPLAYGQQDYYYVFYQLANLPGEKVRPAVNDRQWTALGPLLNQYRHMQAFLVQQGMLPKEEQQIAPRRGRKLPQAAEAPQ